MSPIHDDHIHLRAHTKPPLPHDLASLAAAATERGIVAGIREHAPLPRDYCLGEHRDFEFAMIETELERFLELFQETKVPLGLEVDYLRGYEDETLEIFSGILDAARSAGIEISGVNGSVHLLPGDIDDLHCDKGKVHDIIWDLDESIFIAHLKQVGPAKMMDDYFGRMRDLVQTRMFDTLSHLELLRKFDRRDTDGKSIYFGDVEKAYLKKAVQVLELCAEAGMAVEINTAGMNNLFGRPYLSQYLIEACAAMKIPLCLASDTHKPDGLAAHFDVARDMCRKAGVEKLATVKDRKIVYYDL